MLDGIGEGEEPALFAHHGSNVLGDISVAVTNDFVIEAVDSLQKLELTLLIADIDHVFHSPLAEGKRVLGNILAIIVVDRGSADTLILAQIRIYS